MTNKEIIKEFKKDTPRWAEEMNKMEQKQCMVCGCNPDNLMQLIKAIEELEEKAWKYDELCK